MKTIAVPIPNLAHVKRALLISLGVILTIVFAYLVRQIWMPIAMAFILAMVLDPIVDRMEMRGWKRARASAFIFGSFIFIVSGILVLAYPYVLGQVSVLQDGFTKIFPDTSHGGLIRSFRTLGLSQGLSNGCVVVLESGIKETQHSYTSIADVGMSAAGSAIWVAIVPIIAFYALRDFHVILAKGLLCIPPKSRDPVQTAVSEITSIFGRFLRGLAIVSLLNGVATATLLSILRVPGAFVVGIAAGLLYSVPYIGALITIVLTLAVSFIGGGVHLAVIAVVISVFLHQICFDQIITPRILGGHVGLHPILSIVAMLCGNLLLGIMGMILAVPVAACIQIAVLAVLPKLSKHVDIHRAGTNATDTIESLEQETKADERRIDASEDNHTSVTSAVDFIEQEVAAEAEKRAAS